MKRAIAVIEPYMLGQCSNDAHLLISPSSLLSCSYSGRVSCSTAAIGSDIIWANCYTTVTEANYDHNLYHLISLMSLASCFGIGVYSLP